MNASGSSDAEGDDVQLDKALPADADGMTAEEFLAAGPRLSDFWTPLVYVQREALANNLRVMQQWMDARGMDFMPHGKTTMAPPLWQAQLDAGARGITLATPGQVRTALRLGFTSVMLANEIVSRPALQWIAGRLADPAVSFTCWADGIAGVERMESALLELGTSLARPLDVCVELGAPGKRTGARSIEEAVAVAERLADSPVLRLAGVAGYEGAVASRRTAGETAVAASFVEQLVELHRRLVPLYDDGEVMVTAAGSAYFDVVADVFGAARAEFPRTRWVLRPGAYVVHDHGLYARQSPLAAGDAQRTADDAQRAAGEPGAEQGRLEPAVFAVAQVVSRPEPHLAYLDAGRRDLAYDSELPVPLASAPRLGEPWRPLDGAQVTKLNDQHAYVDLGPNSDVAVGDVVQLGMSHPCTMFDKWRTLPEVDAGGAVVGLIRTYF